MDLQAGSDYQKEALHQKKSAQKEKKPHFRPFEYLEDNCSPYKCLERLKANHLADCREVRVNIQIVYVIHLFIYYF